MDRNPILRPSEPGRSRWRGSKIRSTGTTRKSATSRIWHLRLKIGTLLCAGAIPFSAAIGAHAYVGGGLGLLVVIIEGLQQLFQFHDNWVSYRGTCESLKHEKCTFPGARRSVCGRREPSAHVG